MLTKNRADDYSMSWECFKAFGVFLGVFFLIAFAFTRGGHAGYPSAAAFSALWHVLFFAFLSPYLAMTLILHTYKRYRRK